MTITAEQAAKLLEGTTPGPWRADGAFTEDGCAVRIAMPDRNGVPMQTVAEAFYQQSDDEIYDGERRISWKEAEANARLIAAAPDLATALLASEAARKLAEERLAKVVEGLSALNRAAGEVARQGAVTGSQWTRLNVALLKSRAILKEIDND